MATAKVDKLSLDGFGKGKSELYDAARPRYDPKILTHIRTLIPEDGDINVVEIGCGSGIFTRALLAHPDWTSSLVSLRAIDPNEGMRSVFASTINDPRVTLTDGTFDNTGVENGFADVIVMAAAFHWCLDYEAAVNEFARILKPGGVVVVVSYDADRDGPPYLQQLMALISSYDERIKNATRPGHPHDYWKDVFDAPSYPKFFEPPHEEIVRSTMQATVERITMFMLTISYIAVLSDEQKEVVKDQVKAILDKDEGVEWVDKDQGLLESPQKTMAVSMRRKTEHI